LACVRPRSIHAARATLSGCAARRNWTSSIPPRRGNGNLYPCHGFGPLAWYLNINHGDRLDFLVSMSSKARGLDLYAEAHLPAGHPKRTRKYLNGDVNTCLIRTVNGVSISLPHDTDSPRPYRRIHLVQGTKGLVSGWPQMAVSLEIPGNPRGLPRLHQGEMEDDSVDQTHGWVTLNQQSPRTRNYFPHSLRREIVSNVRTERFRN